MSFIEPTFSLCVATKLALVSALLAVTACSPGPAPISQSSRDPSNPSAPEGVTPMMATASSTAVQQPTSGTGGPGHEHSGHTAATHEGHGAGADASSSEAPKGSAYVCPMHPEVTANAPGLCPKCNMKLVPKK